MTAESSHGTLLKIGDGASPEVFTTIAEVKDINGPGLSANTADSTSHSSGGYTENVVTLLSVGEVTFDILWDPAEPTHDGTTGLLAAFEAKLAVNFQVVHTDAGSSVDSFAANVTKVGKTMPVDGLRTCSVTLMGTGAPTALV